MSSRRRTDAVSEGVAARIDFASAERVNASTATSDRPAVAAVALSRSRRVSANRFTTAPRLSTASCAASGGRSPLAMAPRTMRSKSRLVTTSSRAELPSVMFPRLPAAHDHPPLASAPHDLPSAVRHAIPPARLVKALFALRDAATATRSARRERGRPFGRPLVQVWFSANRLFGGPFQIRLGRLGVGDVLE